MKQAALPPHIARVLAEAEVGAALSLSQIVEETVKTIGGIRRHAQAIRAGLPAENAALASALEALCRECEKGQTDTIELLTRSVLARANPLSGLTDREREVALLIAQGLDGNAIAARLYIATNTVKTHTASIFKKLEVSSRDALKQILKPFLPASSE